jgi:hypothetical protein
LKTVYRLLIMAIVATTILSSSFTALAKPDEVKLTVLEMKIDDKGTLAVISSTDNGNSVSDYGLLGYHWTSTIDYKINPINKQGMSTSSVVTAITTSADTWEKAVTTFSVFDYAGTTTKVAGKRDGVNVVSFGNYRKGVIGVTYLWSRSGHLIETDTTLNTFYQWSLTGESTKMDVQNIMTHEFGHWCGLNDLYADKDYWLTMYGYSDLGLTYAQTLGKGDILGIQWVYSHL